MRTLTSDKDRRDAQLRGRGIQSDTFPTVDLRPGDPGRAARRTSSARDVAVTLPGKLTLHGVVKDVTIDGPGPPRDGRHRRRRRESLPILFADYGIEAPNVAGIIAVQDHGTMEFRVVFAKG